MEESKRCRFFKIVSPSCIELGCLAIPDKFISDFGKKLESRVVVKVPSGKEWHLELREDEEGKVYFHNDWDNFMKYHSIHVWQFLVFQYHGNSTFEVIIFDTTGSEIQYPCHAMAEPAFSPAKNKKRKVDNTGNKGQLLFDEEDDIIVLDKNVQVQYTNDVTYSHGQASKIAPAKFGYENLQSINNIKSKQELEQLDDPVAQESCDVFGSIFRRSNQTRAPAFDLEKFPQERMSSLTSQGVKKATQILPIKPSSELLSMHRKRLGFRREEKATVTPGAFTSKYPFFTVCMYPSYLYKRFLTIPLVFGRKYLRGVKEVTLRVSNGKTWKVQCSFGKTTINLRKQWHAFVVDNHLRKGDVCIFELVDRNQMQIKVSISRVGSKPSPIKAKLQTNNVTCKNDMSGENDRTVQAATSFSSEKPFCSVTMRESYVYENFSLSLPTAFAMKYLKDGYKGITLQCVDGGTWHVHSSAIEPRKVGGGWKTFALDNHLKVDDVCIFELLDAKNMELKVYIFRST